MTMADSAELPKSVDVIVVGAGLAGLTSAYEIQRRGLSVVVLEAQDAVGGRVRTEFVDGFTIDRGFQVLLTAYPELAKQVDIDALNLQAFDPGALVWLNGRGTVVADPFRMPRSLLSTALAPIGSVLDKARIGLLRQRVMRTKAPKLLRGKDVSTVDALRDLGFSNKIIDRFFRPLFGGVQLDPDLATSRRMFDMIFRSLSQGDSALPTSGMSALPEQLATRLEADTIFLNQHVAALDGTTAITASGARITSRAIVVATESPAASGLLGLEKIESRTAGAVYFAADQSPIKDKLVVLDGTGRGPVLNVAVLSNIVPQYAPPGKHLIVAAMPGVIEGDLQQMARTQLRSWWGAQVDGWQHLRTFRITHGGPEQRPPFNPKQSVSLGGGRFVCGDHRDTGSIQGAMFSGRRCGEAVAASLL